MNTTLLIEHAFITAAGWGRRMLPLTDNIPKPMVVVAGQPIIGHVLDRLVRAGVKHVVVNLFYKPEPLQQFLRDYEAAHPEVKIVTIREKTLLDTGGGIRNGLATLPDRPFYVVSGDSFWEDGASGPALLRMAQQWNGDTMDMLLLLQELGTMRPTAGTGDYDIDQQGKIHRSLAQKGLYAWTSVRIIKNKSLFEGMPEGPFSFRDMLDAAEARGRLYGTIHDGQWHHLTTPADVGTVDLYFAARGEEGVHDRIKRR